MTFEKADGSKAGGSSEQSVAPKAMPMLRRRR
jgi:hypothetical protein